MEENNEEKQFEAEKQAIIKKYEDRLKKLDNELKEYI